MVSQGYDGASVMSGNCSGVQLQINERCPYAIYILCCAYILNLVLVDCSKRFSLLTTFFESLYVFMAASKAHSMFVATQKRSHPYKPYYELMTHAELAGMVLLVPFVILLIHFYQHQKRSRMVQTEQKLLKLKVYFYK